MPASAKSEVDGTARLLVLLLAFAWGLNWVSAGIALQEVPRKGGCAQSDRRWHPPVRDVRVVACSRMN